MRTSKQQFTPTLTFYGIFSLGLSNLRSLLFTRIMNNFKHITAHVPIINNSNCQRPRDSLKTNTHLLTTRDSGLQKNNKIPIHSSNPFALNKRHIFLCNVIFLSMKRMPHSFLPVNTPCLPFVNCKLLDELLILKPGTCGNSTSIKENFSVASRKC